MSVCLWLASTVFIAADFISVATDGGNGGYEAFPDICRRQDGTLMVVFYDSYAHVGLPTKEHPHGGRISYVTSSDEGLTWSKPSLLHDGPFDDRDPSIVQLKDGRLLCNFFVLVPGKEGRAYDGAGSWLVESADRGKTWSEPRLIAKDAYCSSPIRELSTGRLILGLYREGSSGATGCVVASDDGGNTWGEVVDIPNAGRRLDAETDVIELNSGALLAMQRAEKGDMAWSTSTTAGKNWWVSQEVGFPGHCPYFLRVDDAIVLAFRLPNTSMRFSRDEGQSWSDNINIDEKIGAYPSMVQLNDGSVLVVYYEEGEGSNIRGRKFRLADAGVEWLDVKD